MTKLLDKICGVMAVLAALLLLFITFSIGYSIFTRQLKLPTPVWVVQFNEYSLLWVTFLGTAWVLHKEKHVSIQLVTERLPARMRHVVGLAHNFVGFGLCAAFCWFGCLTTWDHFVRNVVDVGSVDFPKAAVLSIIPLGFFLLALQFLNKLISDFRHLRRNAVSDRSGRSHMEKES